MENFDFVASDAVALSVYEEEEAFDTEMGCDECYETKQLPLTSDRDDYMADKIEEFRRGFQD